MTDGSATLRLFVAVSIEGAIRQRIDVLLAPIREAERAVAWVPAPKLHLTLRFLGEQPASVVESLTAALHAAATGATAHTLTLGGFGAFPTLRRPRVLWIGVQANDALALLYKKVDDACASLGFGREARAFHPHLTVGRVRPRASLTAGTLAGSARVLDTTWTTHVTTLDLMSSQLGPGGSRYERLVAAPLSPEAR